MSSPSSNDIWIILDSRLFGGIETHVLQLAQGLLAHKQPVQVLLITRYSLPSPIEVKLSDANIPYQILGVATKHALSNLIRLIKQHQPLAIHAHGYKANLLAKIAKIVTNTTLISTYHAGETPTGKVRVYDWLDRITAPIADQSIVVSQAIGNKVYGHSMYVKNFIDMCGITQSVGDDIAFVGRLSPEKAPERFVALAREFPEQNFHIYGTGPMESELQLNPPLNLIFHGHQTDMPAIWPSISILVICSEFEGLPMVALEAMSRGIIVIATSVGELPSLIQHGENGFVVQNASQLTCALSEWLSYSDVQQHQMRQRAKQTVECEYSQNAIVPSLIAIYNGAPKLKPN